VIFEDALRIKAALDQGEFRPGATVTMFLQGYTELHVLTVHHGSRGTLEL